MDGLDSAKCQNSKRRDTYEINTIVNEEEKKFQWCCLLQIKRPKNGQWPGTGDAVAGIEFF